MDAPETRAAGTDALASRRPERPEEIDPALLTDEMEAVGEVVQRRRRVDDTLARFSAVHDELVEEEQRRKRTGLSRFLPWVGRDELDEALTKSAPSLRRRVPKLPDRPAPRARDEEDEGGDDSPAKKASGVGAEPESLSRLQEKKRRRQVRATATAKITAIAAAILVFLVTGGAWGAKVWLNAKFTEIDALDENSAAIRNAAAQSGDQNFLLVGSDTRAGKSGNSKVGTAAQVHGARSDTVMVAHLPADRKRVVLVSFPRDLEVNRPDCAHWDSNSGQYGAPVPGAEHVKLNSVYAEGGPKCMTRVIQQISGLRINHFTGIDFAGFKQMVDAVQGVEVCTANPIKDQILGTVLPKAGKQIISGDTALNYVRARHVFGDPTSDYGRIERQQRFLSALLRKTLSQQVLLSPSKLNAFVNAFAGATYGQNMGVDEMLGLAQSMQSLQSGKVTFITVPTVGYANARHNEVLLTDKTRQLFDAIIGNTPLPGEQGATPPAPPAAPAGGGTNQAAAQQQPAQQQPAQQQPAKPAPVTDPKDVRLDVLNAGNTTQGVAGQTAKSLTALGYHVGDTKNAARQVPHTVIRYAADSQDSGELLARSFPGATLQRDPSLHNTVQLLLGPDFDGKVLDDSGNAAPAQVPDNVKTVNGADASCT